MSRFPMAIRSSLKFTWMALERLLLHRRRLPSGFTTSASLMPPTRRTRQVREALFRPFCKRLLAAGRLLPAPIGPWLLDYGLGRAAAHGASHRPNEKEIS